ncbi:MAG: VWA domain-containing protein, partial [Polyangiaceae bacterium]|nr:VWA domain-containing protein [Polyangiaceae bacterium]
SEGKFRDHVIVVDVSRSMVGERYSRAVQVAERVVLEMDRRDRFVLLACDTTCREMDRQMASPGGAAAGRVREFLGGIEPDGGSDMIEMVRHARRIADDDKQRQQLRVVYIGDGTPSVGPVRAPHVMLEVSRVLPAGSGTLNVVAVGADADTYALAAMARGGGGVLIPYVPGERAAAVAMRVLGASYGMALRNPTVELPEGMTEVYPKTLDNIPAGGESIVVARMRRDRAAGTIKLRGKVGDETYEQSFPIELAASAQKGNAFVPRLYAATKMADLEANQGQSAKTELIALSKKFAVASRYTSLLVLESPAMFKAFGVDRTSASLPSWSGDEESESAASDGLTRFAEDDEAAGGRGGIGSTSGQGFGSGAEKRSARAKARDEHEWAPPPPADAPTPAGPPAARREPAKSALPAPTVAAEERWDRPPPRMVPMRRVWDRKAEVSTDPSKMLERVSAELTKAEADANANPDSRSKLQALLGLYAAAGQVDRVADMAARWSKRDALDPGALVARAEAAARQGDRARAIRILGGLADVRPGDADTQKWLAGLYEQMREPFAACSHRIALADLRTADAAAVADAVRCARSTSRTLLAATLLSDVTSNDVRSNIERELANEPSAPPSLRGDVRLEATWDTEVDLDVALIGKNGQRYSWLGDPKGRVTVRDATAVRRESLAVFNAPRGEYFVELTRASRESSDAPVRGTLTVQAAGSTRTVPFVLSAARTQVGTVRIFYTSRLEPVRSLRGW